MAIRYRRMAGTHAALAVSVVLLGALAPQASAEFDRGQALYENHCRFCHEDWTHRRDSRVVTSIEDLRARVASWSVHAGLDWTAEEIADVTRYLNVHFYQFPK